MEKRLAGKLGRIAGGAVKPPDSQSHNKRRGAGVGGVAHHKPQSDIGKGLERCSPGTFGRSQLGGLALDGCGCTPFPLGEAVPGNMGLEAQGPGSQGIRAKPVILRSPGDRWKRGGHRTPRTLPQAVQTSTPAPVLGASRPVQTGRLQLVTCGELGSRAGNLATAIVVFLPSFTSCWEGRGRQGTQASRGKQPPLTPGPGRGRGSSPRHTHLRIRAAGPPTEELLEGQRKSKFLTKQCWKVPGLRENSI